MKQQPLLSIVVPTKNRYFYLKMLIDLIDSFNNEDIELLVHDNSDNNQEFLEYVNIKQYSFLTYYHTNEQLSMSDNADQAVYKSKGEYVCFIGDDDGVLKNIVDVVKYLKQKGYDALVSQSTIYNWPDFSDASIYHLTSSLLYKKKFGYNYEIDTDKELDNCFNTGLRDMCRLPRLYQGIVSRLLLDKIYHIASTYFPGPSPDMANAISLALLHAKTLYYDFPLIISGQSKYVGGGERLMKKLPKITEVPFLPRNISKTWDKRLPDYWCADTVWPQSVISSYKSMKVEMPPINTDKILATFIFDHFAYYNECKSYINNKIYFLCCLLTVFFKKAIHYLYWRLSFMLSNGKSRAGVIILRDVNSIGEAVNILQNKL